MSDFMSRDHRDRLEDYGFKNGFLNIAFMTGMMRFRTKDGFFIQQTERLGQSPYIYVPSTVTIPARFRDGDWVSARARVIGERDDAGIPRVRLNLIRLDGATAMDISPTEAWSLRPNDIDAIGAPTPGSFIVPKSIIRPSDGERPTLLTKFRASHNDIKLTGLIAAQQQARHPATGEPRDDAYELLLRVSEKLDETILVKVVKRRALAWMREYKIGSPVHITGALRVRVKPVPVDGQPDAERLVQWPYIRTERGPELATPRDINADEPWAEEMIRSAMKRRAAEVEKSGTRARDLNGESPQVMETSPGNIAAPPAGEFSMDDVRL